MSKIGKENRIRSVLITTIEFPPGPGGIGTVSCKVALHLQRLGWKVSVVAEQRHASEDEIKEFNAVQPFRVLRIRSLPVRPIKGIYRLLITFISILRERPEIIIASHPQMVWIASFLSFFHRLPVVAIGNGTEYRHPPGWKRRITKWAFSRTTAVVNISRFTETLMSSAGISAKRQTIIPPGVDGEDFEGVALSDVERLRERAGLQDAKVILTVAMISERKAQDIIIRAMPDILKQIPNAHYLIVGVPERLSIKKKYFDLVVQLGVEDFVHFVGKVPQSELPLYYHLCDIFALTSRESAIGSTEGYGIVAVEAALCGKPSVVSEGSGLMEAIVPGKTGLSVPQEDPQAAAKAIISLLNNNQMRHQMGEAAREFSSSSQGWNQRIVEYDSFLNELIG